MVKAALIGVGNMGKKYAEMITSGEVRYMKLTAVVIRRDEQLPWGENLVNADGSKPEIYRSTDELFADSDKFDAVLIVTPHKTHPELARRAFEAGKDVLCDKPAGATIKDANGMNASAKACGKVYGMVFHQRLYPKYRKIKEMKDSGELGEIKRIMLVNSRYLRTSRYHKSGGWRSSWAYEGGGALINQGQHILDIWQWLFGMPERIYAEIPFGKYNDFLVDDEATITMKYSNGATGVFMLTTGEAHYEERLEVVGTRGKIILEDDKMHIFRYDDITEYISTQKVNSRENLKICEEIIEFTKEAEPYTELLDNFALVAMGTENVSLIAPGEDAVNPLMLTCSAYYSAVTGQAVRLPLDEEEYNKMLNNLISREK
ncbi:MAG: Gfo/Idh/MocA family protein [Lachnospira sp.]